MNTGWNRAIGGLRNPFYCLHIILVCVLLLLVKPRVNCDCWSHMLWCTVVPDAKLLAFTLLRWHTHSSSRTGTVAHTISRGNLFYFLQRREVVRRWAEDMENCVTPSYAITTTATTPNHHHTTAMCGMCVYVWQWPVCGQLVFVFTSKGRWIGEGESWWLAAEPNSLFEKLSRSLLLLFWLSSSALRPTRTSDRFS